MRALRIQRWQSEAELVEVDQPHPAPGQVVIKVGGAGACHSDLHLMEATGVPWSLPLTLGHENAGWVYELGAGITSLRLGQAVAVHGPWGCKTCARCVTGADNYCENPLGAPVPGGGGGLGADGGMAEFMLVPDVRYLVPLPDGLLPMAAAPLTDAGLTSYHAIRRSWPKLEPSATAVVIGIGGLGHMAIQILKVTTAARIIAVDNRESALELARTLGADLALSTSDSAATEIKAATPGGRGADVVLDCVGTAETLTLASRCARTLGDVTVVGVAGGTVPFGFFTAPYEVSFQSVYWGTRPELVEVLDLGARGHLRPITTTYPLDQAAQAYRDLAAGYVTGRAVVVPNEVA